MTIFTFCQTPVQVLGLGVDFVLPLSQQQQQQEQAGAELCQAQDRLSSLQLKLTTHWLWLILSKF